MRKLLLVLFLFTLTSNALAKVEIWDRKFSRNLIEANRYIYLYYIYISIIYKYYID